MTATLEAAKQARRLDDAEYQARLEHLRAYVEQLERADRQADTGSLQRAADLMAIYEDRRWVEDMPDPKPSRRPHLFKVVPDSREQFYKWAKDHITSPTTSQPLHPSASRRLLDAEDIRAIVRHPLADDSATVTTLSPLAKLLKAGRGEEAPEVWRRAIKLAEAEGQELPGKAAVRRALADHNKARGIKAPVSKRTVASYEHKVEQGFDWLVRHNTPEENRALLRRLAERLKAEHQWARGEQAS
jgi:hypothetical protein